MSCANRSIARLPLSVFTDLKFRYNDNEEEDKTNSNKDAENLRTSISTKLRNIHHGKGEGITTVGQLLKLSSPSLLGLLDPLLTNEECNEFMRRVYAVCAASRTTALSLLEETMDTSLLQRNTTNDASKMRHIPSGMTTLDACLHGGFRVGCITEIVGGAGVGKTQLAMQLCVMASRYRQGSVYIDTERKISIPRLYEMASSSDAVLENVTLHSPACTKSLMDVLSKLEEDILTLPPDKFPIRLLVLDSVTAPTQRDVNASTTPSKKVSFLFSVASLLKRLADRLQLAVVVVNQPASRGDSTAALGTSWHHCVSSRILLELSQNSVGDGSVDLRVAKVIKSNVAGFSSMHFTIASSGLCEI